jgi:cyclically-permuted mutarotase family protein
MSKMVFVFFKSKFNILYLLLCLSHAGFSQEETVDNMTWDIVAEFAGELDHSKFGFAGCYAGVHNDAMLIAGGANFPNGLPWEGGEKYWSDKIFVLEKSGDDYIWNDKTFKLPHALAYGFSVSIPEGVLCIGGRDANQEYSEVFLLKWNVNSEEITIEEFPSLPFPLAHLSATKLDNKIYVAGGESKGETTNHFLTLDLSQKGNDNWKWNQESPLPGKSRAYSVLSTQANGTVHGVYLFSGRSYNKAGTVEILSDGYFYNPKLNQWEVLNSEFPVMAGNAFSAGLEFVVFPSGTDGTEFLKLKSLEDEIKSLEKSEDFILVKDLKSELTNRLKNHKGFSKNILAYNTITKTIVKISDLPYGVVTAPLVKWDDNVFIVSGEISPGVRTPSILKGRINIPSNTLGALNILVLVIYFILLLCMGYYFSKRQKNTDDYFKGGGRVPWWAAGLSIFGTGLSAITFMAIPAKAYATDWAYVWFNVGVLLMAPIIIYLFIPVFRKMNISTAYEYLERRFNVVLRVIGSISFILFQIGRMAVVLFLPAIAINVVTGIDIYICILSMGILSLLYTLMGGIEAVIWTDALQVVVLMGGAILCLILMIVNIDGGFSEIVNVAIENNKFNAFDIDFNWYSPTLWVVLFGGFFTSLATYGSDQTMVQRYLTTADEKGAVKSLLTNVWLTLPATVLFFFVGTALFVFFKQHPQDMNFSLSNGDSIFPWYIVKELPNGVVGLLISGILAAAMSSVSSSINSAAASYSMDIHFRFWKTSNNLKTARVATFTVGVLGTLVALFMAGFEIKSLWDVFNKVLGLILGSMSGLFLLGILIKKANSNGALIGFVGSIFVQIYVANQTDIHLLLYTATGLVSCFLLGVIGSVMFPKVSKIRVESVISNQ